MAFWTYMLRCSDGRFYVGHTDDLDRRMAQHHSGGFCDFTARRQPTTLVWSENFQTRIEALAAEKRIKGWSRAKKEALIAGDWARIKQLAVAHEARPSTSLRTNGGRGSASHKQTVRPEPVEGWAPHATRTGEAP
jgi:predicted GIY-YIG superfamily endonuclease